MRLPDELRTAIEREIASIPAAELSRAAAEITEHYKRGDFSAPVLRSAAHRAAYLAIRVPATYAACRKVLQRISEHLPAFAPQSLLDLGAGPGTAMWAAADLFPSLDAATLVERDADTVRIGQCLAMGSPNDAVRNAQWRTADLASSAAMGSADLVMLSYALGELKHSAIEPVLEKAWQETKQILVIVEPGTPSAFSRILEARQWLADQGAPLVAPCPHAKTCPMRGTQAWCHFSARLERTAAHRRLKDASLGYEDEKFSYLIFSRTPAQPAQARVVRHPRIHGGHVQLELCDTHGLSRITVGKSKKDAYRRARKAEWGDRWQPS
ncbi:MAG: rRNA methyltransferase [Acidobacteriales bacterium]|nr:rRNA methyltransferase [Terriglobales bacterium]